MTERSTLKPKDTPTFLRAALQQISEMHAKKLFFIGAWPIRLLPLVLFIWAAMFVVATITWEHPVSAVYIYFSLFFVPMVWHLWCVGLSYSQFLRLRQPLGFWQMVGLGAPLVLFVWSIVSELCRK